MQTKNGKHTTHRQMGREIMNDDISYVVKSYGFIMPARRAYDTHELSEEIKKIYDMENIRNKTAVSILVGNEKFKIRNNDNRVFNTQNG